MFFWIITILIINPIFLALYKLDDNESKEISTFFNNFDGVLTIPIFHFNELDSFIIAEKIRKTTEDAVFENNLKKTISIGLCSIIGQEIKSSIDQTIISDLKEKIVNLADNSLYKAKENGRNQTINGFHFNTNL